MMDSSTNESYTIDAAYFHLSLFLVCCFLVNNHIICPTPHTHNVVCVMLPLLGSYIKYFQTGPSVKITVALWVVWFGARWLKSCWPGLAYIGPKLKWNI